MRLKSQFFARSIFFQKTGSDTLSNCRFNRDDQADPALCHCFPVLVQRKWQRGRGTVGEAAPWDWRVDRGWLLPSARVMKTLLTAANSSTESIWHLTYINKLELKVKSHTLKCWGKGYVYVINFLYSRFTRVNKETLLLVGATGAAVTDPQSVHEWQSSPQHVQFVSSLIGCFTILCTLPNTYACGTVCLVTAFPASRFFSSSQAWNLVRKENNLEGEGFSFYTFPVLLPNSGSTRPKIL